MKTINININPNKGFIINRLAYTLEFVNNHPYTPNSIKFVVNDDGDPSIIYDNKSDEKGSKRIHQSGYLFKEKNIKLQDINYGSVQYNDYNVHFVYRGKSFINWYEKEEINFDLFESIFFFIARVEEIFCDPKFLDEFNRFPSSHSFVVKHHIEKQPIVDLLVKFFLEWVGIVPDILQIKTYITHDLDEISKFNGLKSLLMSWMGTLKRRESVKNIKILTQNYLKETDPYDTFDFLLLKDHEYEKYIFVPGVSKHVLDPEIWNREEKVNSAAKKALERNYKLGVHPGIESAIDVNKLKHDIEFVNSKFKLNKIYNRFHYLVFDWRITPFILEQVDVDEDHSLGWNDITGYRCGTGIRYRLYNFKEERAFSFHTVPLVCMDVALQRESDYSLETALSILNKLDKNKTANFSSNFHNSIFFQSQLLRFPMNEVYNILFKRKDLEKL